MNRAVLDPTVSRYSAIGVDGGFFFFFCCLAERGRNFWREGSEYWCVFSLLFCFGSFFFVVFVMLVVVVFQNRFIYYYYFFIKFVSIWRMGLLSRRDPYANIRSMRRRARKWSELGRPSCWSKSTRTWYKMETRLYIHKCINDILLLPFFFKRLDPSPSWCVCWEKMGFFFVLSSLPSVLSLQSFPPLQPG